MTPLAANDDPLALLHERLLDLLRLRIARAAPRILAATLVPLLALPERTMRAAVLTERLRRVDAVLAEALLAWVHDGALRRRPGAQELLMDLCLERPLAEALGYDAARRIHRRARDLGHDAVARTLLSHDGAGPLPAEEIAENLKMPDESLGRRKQLARGRNRLALDRLLWDRHPSVVALLLQNPVILERDVIRIAAMRPTNPACLVEVFRHPRWVCRYRVKVALAANPSTPADLAQSLLSHLMLPELHHVAAAQALHPSVRETARELIRRRDGQPWSVDPPAWRLAAAGDEPAEPELDLDAVASELANWMAPPLGR
jgi:hypothetical protein